MESERDKAEVSKGIKSGSALKKRLSPLWYSLIFAGFLFESITHHHSKPAVVWMLFLVMSVLSVISPGWFTRLLLWTLGTLDYIEVSDPKVVQRTRKWYESEISQLTNLGFAHLFYEGETISIFKLLMIFPAIVFFGLWLRRQVFTEADGRLIAVSPTFGAESKIAYAQADSMGVKFRTVFKDGTILESKNYGDEDMPTGPSVITHCFKRETISNTWAQHQKWIRLLETEDNPVDQELSFRAWVAIIHKVSADLRQHL